MAVIIPVYSVCEKCGHKDLVDVQITVNGSISEDIDLVTSDKLNIVQCSICGHKSRAKTSVYYYAAIARRAVWYKPCGDDEFFSIAKGISPADDIKEFDSWETFKDEIQKLEKVQSILIKATAINIDNLRESCKKVDLIYRNLVESIARPGGPIFVLRDGKSTAAINEESNSAVYVFWFFMIIVIIILFGAIGSLSN